MIDDQGEWVWRALYIEVHYFLLYDALKAVQKLASTQCVSVNICDIYIPICNQTCHTNRFIHFYVTISGEQTANKINTSYSFSKGLMPTVTLAFLNQIKSAMNVWHVQG